MVAQLRVSPGEDLHLAAVPDAPAVDDTPPPGEPEELREPIVSVAAARMVVDGLAEFAAATRGDHWRLDDDEADRIAEPLAGELSDLAEHAPFLRGAVDRVGSRRTELLMALGFAVGPRVATDIALRREARAAEARSAGPATPQAPSPPPAQTGGYVPVTDPSAQALNELPPEE